MCASPNGAYVIKYGSVSTNAGVTPAERLVADESYNTNKFRLTGYYTLAAGQTEGVIFSISRAGLSTW